jgi:hypothetical protein
VLVTSLVTFGGTMDCLQSTLEQWQMMREGTGRESKGHLAANNLLAQDHYFCGRLLGIDSPWLSTLLS